MAGDVEENNKQRIIALEREKLKLQKELTECRRAINILDSKLKAVDRKATTAYHASRDAGNKISHINDKLSRKS